jgi:hypothetical protein
MVNLGFSFSLGFVLDIHRPMLASPEVYKFGGMGKQRFLKFGLHSRSNLGRTAYQSETRRNV